MKRIISIVLCLMIVFSLIPTVFAAEDDAVISVTANGAVEMRYDLFRKDGLNYYTVVYENHSDSDRNVQITCTISNGDTIYSSNSKKETVESGDSLKLNTLTKINTVGSAVCEICVNDGVSEKTITRELYTADVFLPEDEGNADFGVQTKVGENRTYYNDIIGAAKASGSGIVREYVGWYPYFETSKGYIRPYENLDNAVNLAKEYGVEMLLCFAVGNPIYEVAQISDNPHVSKFAIPYPDANNEAQDEYNKAFMNFISFVVNRYKDTVHYWEIWNEPNHHNFNRNGTTPSQYAALLRQATELIHSIDPTATVIGMSTAGVGQVSDNIVPSGSVSAGAGTWIEETLKALENTGGIASAMDAISVHMYYQEKNPFEYFFNSSGNWLTGLKKIMTDYNCMDMPVWVTETGSFTGELSDSISETEQAIRTVMTKPAFDYYLKKSGMNPGKVILYDIQDDGTSTTNSESNYGLMSNSFVPKKAFSAMSTFNKVMAGKKLESYTTGGYFSPWVMKYTSDEGEGHFIYSQNNNVSYTTTLTGDRFSVYDIEGNVVDSGEIDGSLSYSGTAGKSPLMIHTYYDNTVAEKGFINVNTSYSPDKDKLIATGYITGYDELNQTIKYGFISSGDTKNYTYSDFTETGTVATDDIGEFKLNADLSKVKNGDYRLVMILSDDTVYKSDEFEIRREGEFYVDNVVVEDYFVTVSGNVYANANVLINVVPKGTDIASFTPQNIMDRLSYIQQVKADTDGNFEFNFKAGSGTSKIYEIYISAPNADNYFTTVAIGKNEAATLKALKNDSEIMELSDISEGDKIKFVSTYYGDETAVLIGVIRYSNDFEIVTGNEFTYDADKNKYMEIELDAKKDITGIDVYLWKNLVEIIPLTEAKRYN